jgi:hypothetical protein
MYLLMSRPDLCLPLPADPHAPSFSVPGYSPNDVEKSSGAGRRMATNWTFVHALRAGFFSPKALVRDRTISGAERAVFGLERFLH